jgi:hypothetical protein
VVLEEIGNRLWLWVERCNTLVRHLVEDLNEVLRKSFSNWEEASMTVRTEGPVEDCLNLGQCTGIKPVGDS